MGKLLYLTTTCFVIVLAGIVVVSNAIAGPATQMTSLEKKLYEAARKEGKLIYWNSLGLKEVSQFIKAFNDRYPGIEISYWEGNQTQSDEKYIAEQAAGRNPVDVLAIEWYEKYNKEGWLMNLQDIVKDTGFPKESVTPDFDAVGIEHTIRGVSYNTRLVAPKDVPRSWEDLLDPKWKGKIAIENTMSVFITLTDTWGEKNIIGYLRQLREQNPLFNSGVTNTMTLLGAGEFPIAINTLLSNTLILQSRGQSMDFAPISPMADKFAPYVVVKNAPHPNAAKLFIRWLMGSEGQSMVDKVRKKGNPMPGSGTVQSKALEKLGIRVVMVPAWGLDYKSLQDTYQEAVGFRRSEKTKK